MYLCEQTWRWYGPNDPVSLWDICLLYTSMIEWAGVDPENGDPLWYMDEEDENHNPTGKRITTNDYGSADYYYVKMCIRDSIQTWHSTYHRDSRNG